MLPSYSNSEVWTPGIYSHTSSPSLALGDISSQNFTLLHFYSQKNKQTTTTKKKTLYCVAGVPSKLSNCGSKCQWDMGRELTPSATTCGGSMGNEWSGNERVVVTWFGLFKLATGVPEITRQ